MIGGSLPLHQLPITSQGDAYHFISSLQGYSDYALWLYNAYCLVCKGGVVAAERTLGAKDTAFPLNAWYHGQKVERIGKS